MRPLCENLPFVTIFLAITAGILCAVLRSGRAAWRLTMLVTAANTVLSAILLAFIWQTDRTFTYTMAILSAAALLMGLFPGPLLKWTGSLAAMLF